MTDRAGSTALALQSVITTYQALAEAVSSFLVGNNSVDFFWPKKSDLVRKQARFSAK
jgi:hypothetical protein